MNSLINEAASITMMMEPPAGMVIGGHATSGSVVGGPQIFTSFVGSALSSL